MRSIEIRADDETIQALEVLAEGESTSVEALAREALERYLRLKSRLRPHNSRRLLAKPYRIHPISVGRCYFEDLDNIAEVLAAAEGEDRG